MIERRRTHHRGLDAVEIIDGDLRMIVVHEVGPRIAAFHRTGHENFLYWDDAGEHRHGEWRLYGGHRVWTTRPGADESEETYAPDNARCTVHDREDGIDVIAPPTASRIEKSLLIRPAAHGWNVVHRIRNVGDFVWAGGAWGLTCTRPTATTRYRIPLDGGSPRWDLFTMVIPRRWAGHTSRLDDSQFAIDDDAITFHASGAESKRMVATPRGVIEMYDPSRGVLSKRAMPRDGAYPHGTNLAVYLGPENFMVEIESMSPFATLAPGDELVHVETWTVAHSPTHTS